MNLAKNKIKLVEDQNKSMSSYMHFQRMQKEVFASENIDPTLKRLVLLSYSAKNDKDIIVGGIVGWISYDFAYIEALWVDIGSRNLQIGSNLVRLIEQKAQELQCSKILVTTNGYSLSMNFWIKNDFQNIYELKDTPKGSSIYYLQKLVTG